ncbi:hypothetical protein [Streptomyces sp. 1222.5]|uniref:hypothetical protein n=1 Tax=Streptomyces sp. 1222.5 TaxID=1881026 RepID=UPI003D7464F8
MNDNITERLAAAGFDVIGPFSDSGPTVSDVFHRVMNVEAQPSEKIPRASADAPHRVTESWKTRARNSGVLASDDTFLAAGSLAYGWVHLRLTNSVNISALQDPEGDLLFVSRSEDGRHACAVSREGTDYWIIEADFS